MVYRSGELKKKKKINDIYVYFISVAEKNTFFFLRSSTARAVLKFIQEIKHAGAPSSTADFA